MPLRILIADDHDLVRHGVRMLLEAHPGWSVCGQAKNGLSAVKMTQQLKPDIVILDMSMPDLNGLEAARRITLTSPRTEILIFSVHHTDQLIREIIEIGVRGYVLKSDSETELIAAVEALAKHKPYFTNCMTEVLLSKYNSGAPVSEKPDSVGERLTSRQREILQLIVEGKSCKEVAAHLNISAKTVGTHRSNIMRILQVHNVTGLVMFALRNEIIRD